MGSVAYALKVLHSEREWFEQQHGWKIKKMEAEDQSLVHDYDPEMLEPSPVQDEYAPVIFSQETVKHIISIDMMSGMVSSHLEGFPIIFPCCYFCCKFNCENNWLTMFKLLWRKYVKSF
jgi:hypothetical protein